MSTRIVRYRIPSDTTSRWAKHFGSTGVEYGTDVALDADENIVIVGPFNNTINFGTSSSDALTTAGAYDTFVAKLSKSDGSRIWSFNFGGTGNEVPKTMAIDGSGNILVISSLTGGTFFKLNSVGILQWISGPVATSPATVTPLAIATSSDGSVIIAGNFAAQSTNPINFGNGHTLSSTAGSTDMFLAKYSGGGVCQWAIKGIENQGGSEFGTGVAVNQTDGTIYWAGYTSGGVNLGGEGLFNNSSGVSGVLGKFDSNGNHLFSRTVGTKGPNASSTAFSRTAQIKLDNNGDVIVSGIWKTEVNLGGATRLVDSGSTAAENLLYVAKYNGLNLNYQWDVVSKGTLRSTPFNLAVDSSGKVYLIGSFEGSIGFGTGALVPTNGRTDIFIAECSSSGVIQPFNTYGGTGNDSGIGIAVDATQKRIIVGSFEGSLTLSGQSLMSAGSLDLFVAYDP